ncbi:MAG: hypothetical protein ACOCP4_05165 [Candidatus Woesearchaeota archaeon]
MKKHYIGFVDNKTCDSKNTKKQIKEIMKYDLDLYYQNEKSNGQSHNGAVSS